MKQKKKTYQLVNVYILMLCNYANYARLACPYGNLYEAAHGRSFTVNTESTTGCPFHR